MTWTPYHLDEARVQHCAECAVEERGKFGLRCWYCGGPMFLGELKFHNVVRSSEVR